MVWREERLSIREALRLGSEAYSESQFDTARQFAQRALASAEAIEDASLEIASRYLLMQVCLWVGDSEQALAQAVLLLEFLYAPETLAALDDKDEVLGLIVNAFPSVVISSIQSSYVELINNDSKIFDRLSRVIDEGFSTLEQLGRNEHKQTLYYVRGELARVSGDSQTALENHEIACSLWRRVPEGRTIEEGCFQLALAQDYTSLGQHRKSISCLERILQDSQSSSPIRVQTSSMLSFLLLDEGQPREAESFARQALEMADHIESPLMSIYGRLSVLEVLLDMGKGHSLVHDGAALLKLARRFRAYSQISAMKQVAYSHCGEIRLQQALHELNLSADYDSLLKSLPPTPEDTESIHALSFKESLRKFKLLGRFKRRKIVSLIGADPQVEKNCTRLLKQALRWFGRVSAFEQRKVVDVTKRLLMVITERSSPKRLQS